MSRLVGMCGWSHIHPHNVNALYKDLTTTQFA
jgi:hypothetical protein